MGCGWAIGGAMVETITEAMENAESAAIDQRIMGRELAHRTSVHMDGSGGRHGQRRASQGITGNTGDAGSTARMSRVRMTCAYHGTVLGIWSKFARRDRTSTYAILSLPIAQE
jgi:hypothetical protein